MARLSLAEQIALLDAPPQDIDPEDALHAHPHPKAAGVDENEAAEGEVDVDGRSHYVDVGPSRLRSIAADPTLMEGKYEGVKASRGSLFDTLEFEESEEDEHSEEEEEASEDDDEEEKGEQDEEEREISSVVKHTQAGRTSSRSSKEEEEEQDEEGSRGDDDESQSADEANTPPPQPNGHSIQKSVSFADPSTSSPPPTTLTTPPSTTTTTPSNPQPAPTPDALKGLTLLRQTSTHNALLTARISFQRTLTSSNRLPLPAHIHAYTSHPDAVDVVRELERELRGLEEDVWDVRRTMLEKNGVSLPPSLGKRKRSSISDHPTSDSNDDTDDDSNHVQEEADFAQYLLEAHTLHSALSAHAHPYTLQTLRKWSQKILPVHAGLFDASSSSAAAAAGGQISRFALQTQAREAAGGGRDAVQAVEAALAPGERVRLVRKVRKQGEGRIGPQPHTSAEQPNSATGEGEEEDPEIFDDSEFYGLLLREILDSRRTTSSTLADGSVSSSALDSLLPNRRSKLFKKPVDTRASKGRKIRYEVHEKLRHFMVPMPQRAFLPSAVLAGSAAAGRGGVEWGEAQVDELFGSLLGGAAGQSAAPPEEEVRTNGTNGVNGHVRDAEDAGTGMDVDVTVGQLRVFG